MNPTVTPPPPSAPAGGEAPDAVFLDMIRELGRRKALGEISGQLREVVEAVQATGKTGALALVIKIVPRSATDVVAVDLDYAVTLKMPKRALPTSLFFIGENGGLSRRDTRQAEMDFRPSVVNTPAPAVAPAAPPAAAAANA